MIFSFSEEKYQKEIETLFKRFPSVQNVPFKDAYKPGLDRMVEFACRLGNPQEKFRSVHVAGTNGKGSVSNMLASAFASCGYKVGLYTSPHILDFRERMRVASPLCSMVSKEYVYDFVMTWKETFEELRLSFFEITTAMAFKWFADEKVDVAVIEVGLGGTLDSTNIITPELSIVTSIGLDHCALLGDTLAKIAGEKAGIFKTGVPALVGEVVAETEPVFVAKAAGVGSDLTFAEREIPSGWECNEMILREMDLQGWYQKKNLRTVLAAIDILKVHFSRLGDSAAALRGLVHTASAMDFHGRWERLSTHPDVICDIGHNAHALKNNFGQLRSQLEDGTYSALIIIYGIMADKNLDDIMPLMPSDATWIFTTPDTARALPAQKILEKRRSWCAGNGADAERLFMADKVKDAVRMAMDLAKGLKSEEAEPLVYIGGSTFVVAEAAPLFK